MKAKYKFEIEVENAYEIDDEEVQNVAKKAIEEDVPLMDESIKQNIIEAISDVLGSEALTIKFKNESYEIV